METLLSVFPSPVEGETLHQEDWSQETDQPLLAVTVRVWLPPLLSKVRDDLLTDSMVFGSHEVTKRQRTMPIKAVNNRFMILFVWGFSNIINYQQITKSV